MVPDHELSAEQRRSWEQQIAPRLGRGVLTRVARALQAAREGDLAAWKTRLTGFKRGEAKALQAVLGSPRRRRVVAKELGVDESEFAVWLARARGVQVDEDPFTAFVPGFEAYGPVPAQAMPMMPPVSYSASIDRGAGPQIQSGHNPAWPDVLSETLATRSRAVDHVVWIVGPPGSGRTALLRAGASALREAGEQVCFWGRAVESWNVMVCDDLDRLELGERGRLLAAFGSPGGGRVLLVSAGAALALGPALMSQCVFAVVATYIDWSRRACERLVTLARERWALVLDLGGLLQWLEDEPLALMWVPSPVALGVVTRMVADGMALPPEFPVILERSFGQLARRARIGGDDDAALILEHVGAAAMVAAVREACRDTDGGLTLPMMARAFVGAAAGISTVEPQQHGPAGMLAVAERLRRLGALGGPASAMYVVSPVLLGAALGQSLINPRGEVDVSLLMAIVVRPAWHLALIAAAQQCKDTAPLFRALLALPAGTTCQAPAAMLPVLTLRIPCSDSDALRRVFATCLGWWLQALPPPAQVRLTLTLGAHTPQIELPRPHPYLLLAAAAILHRTQLPAAWDAAGLISGLPEPLSAYAGWLGLTMPEADELRDRLAIAVPWFGDRMFAADFWGRLPPLAHSGWIANLGLEDVQTWWLRCAAPRFVESPEGVRRMLGLVGELSIVAAMGQPDRGTALWRAALAQVLAEDGERAAPAWEQALAFTLMRGGTANLAALRALWSGLPPALRAKIGERSAAVLLVSTGRERLLEDVVAWLIESVIPESALRSAWGALQTELPWRAFLARGTPRSKILRWALRSLPATAPDPTRTPQGEAIATLLAEDDIDVIAELCRRRSPWRDAAAGRLLARIDGPARWLRFRLAIGCEEPARSMLLQGLIDETSADEAHAWRRVAHGGRGDESDLVLHVVADLAAGDATWSRTVAALRYAEDLLSDDAPAQRRWLRRLPRGARAPDARELRRQLAQTGANGLLGQVGICIELAASRGLATDLIVGALLKAPRLRRYIAGGIQAPIWRLLAGHLDDAKLQSLLEDVAGPELLPARASSLLGDPRSIRILLGRPRLTAAMAVYLCSPWIQVDLPWLASLCDLISLAAFDPAVAQIWGLCLAKRGVEGAKHLARRLDGMAGEEQRVWWQAVLPHAPEGVVREVVLRAIFEPRQGAKSAPR